MANQNVFISPGVFNREFDLSFLPQEIPAVGAAVIGPTVRGPAMVPVPISTYSEYIRWFGDTFSSGSGASEKLYKYLTTYTVQEYLRAGQVCTVLRVLAGNYQPSYSNVIQSSSHALYQTAASASVTFGQNAMALWSCIDQFSPGTKELPACE